MGRLQHAIDALNRMDATTRGEPPTEQEVHVQAITESLVDMTERLEKALSSKTPIQPKDYTEALGKIAIALGQKDRTDELIAAIKGVNLSPTVNVEAPRIERAGPMLFEVRRNENGQITTVLAKPYEGESDDSTSDDYEIE